MTCHQYTIHRSRTRFWVFTTRWVEVRCDHHGTNVSHCETPPHTGK